MKHTKTVDVPATTRVVVERTTCDLCGQEIKSKRFGVDEVEILRREGTSYPEGGSGTECAVDMCGDCFEKKLVPWLESQGAKVLRTEWDW